MNNAIILGAFCLLVAVGAGGYFLGRYQAKLANTIRTLEGQSRAPKPEPIVQAPTVITGAYQPPKQISTSVDKKQKAGLVETKTPERLDWENKNEIADLERA